jgi:hypothetical protein
MRVNPVSQINLELTVVDVHRYFKAETQIGKARCFPFHVDYLQKWLLGLGGL